MKVICVLRSGGIYNDMRYLEHLSAGVDKYLGVPLWCLSDMDVPNRIPLKTNWPGWWAKMELFRPDLEDDFLFFDLDTVICGDLSEIAAVDKFTVIHHFYRMNDPRRVGSGMMFIPHAMKHTVWNKWIVNPSGQFHNTRGDQDFIEKATRDHQKWQDVVPGQVVSFKRHCQNGLPQNARVVCYHGIPKPHETGWATHR